MTGDPYDWTITKKPERPYIHDYTRTFTSKIGLSRPNVDNSSSVVSLDIAQAAEVIKQVDIITLGIPKIIYLVGWQYFGHDSKYPAWHEVNDALKRPGDKTALESLLWLFREAKKYNTTISLHINMWDSYENSPLWREYLDAGVITLDEDGGLHKIGVWNRLQSYAINYKREWESGLAKKRIDDLCAMLPIKETGTIHIDAMHAIADPGHGDSLEDVQKGRAQIIRYWRDLGVDVTSEHIYHEGEKGNKQDNLIGLVPLVWLYEQTLAEYISRPASLVSGINQGCWQKSSDVKFYSDLFGTSANVRFISKPDGWQETFFNNFMKKNLKQLYLNTLERKSAVITNDGIRVEFSDGVETRIKLASNGYTDPQAARKGALLESGGDLLYPVPWLGNNKAIAYSENGCGKEYDLSVIMDWQTDKKINLARIDVGGASVNKQDASLKGGKLFVELEASEALMIEGI